MTALVAFLKAMADSTLRVIITTTSIVIFWVFVSWSLGLVPAFGQGFARQEDVKSIQIYMLEGAIIEARIRYCAAPPGTPAKQYFLKHVNAKSLEYRAMTGSNYQLPTCEELIVASN